MSALLAVALVASAARLAPERRPDGETPVGGPPPLESVVRLGGAQAQLAHARTMKGRLIGASGAEREEARRRAVEAYTAVWRYWPREPEACGEAAFRAGELLRAGGDESGALAAFRRVRRLAPRTTWRARAAVELGHCHRRAGRLTSALASYGDACFDPLAASVLRDRAHYWAGRVEELRGDPEAARRRYEHVARSGADPVERIRACDRLVLQCLRRGDRRGAAQLFEHCRASVADVAAERTESGERVRAALARSTRSLARANERLGLRRPPRRSRHRISFGFALRTGGVPADEYP